ncbi:DEAD/DEAH box helicase [Phyllobacterium sp. 0TCS1.6C]|uniref:DEAD/DEAH box helicase n=1 Tax=unclassified Phyllobacterium TaxID=2638441 RepID=UPI00226501BE|nr:MULTISPECIES: DEAD/DEAH box helicase [unclassified Phyllobacterium]MCX8281560.1 DEAD/DEAH box helicase [Phyllobacterium sp. 0TCS1.6C]MCX8292844.1 DEAD/DEAH box helicase [Phyllobacterium sp. 0TCS1.6A]
MTSFDSIAPALSGALTARGYTSLTPVQTAVLAPEAAGADLLVSAQTGSGKTVAFGIAIAPTLLGDSDRFATIGAPFALIIAPTRELALQVRREFEWLYEKTGARIASCVGGMDMMKERRALQQGAHIVVGTPGRLRDHITRGSLDMSELRAVVLDEADEMLDLGFREDLEFILAEAPEDRRTLMFSATVPKPIAALAKQFQNNALRISATSEREQHADIEYHIMPVAPRERENAIINSLLYYDAQNTIIFGSTREAVKHLTSRLSNRGFSVVSLSGELSQAERTNALQAMRDGRARVCVATDVAARGIDLPNLDLVIHADLPNNSETLLHRSGRTGRAGRKGICVLIVPASRRRTAERLLQGAKLATTMVPPPNADAINQRNRERIFNDAQLREPIVEEEAEDVAALLELHSVEQIAAAYLRQQFAARPAPEELSNTPAHVLQPIRESGRRGSDDDRPQRGERGARSERRDHFESGGWFALNVGRKQRAEPRWLLPLICKAGDITKSDVGSIKILDGETRFEISADKADAFLARIKQFGSGEKGVNITRSDAPGFSGRGSGDFKPKKQFGRERDERGYKSDRTFEPAGKPGGWTAEKPAKAKKAPKERKPGDPTGFEKYQAKKARKAAAGGGDKAE